MKKNSGESLRGDLLDKLIGSKRDEFTKKAYDKPNQLYLLPLTDKPFFPTQTLPLIMNEKYWRASLDKINESPMKLAGLVLSSAKTADRITASNCYQTGTLIRVHHPVSAAKKIQFIAEGLQRFKITKWLSRTPPYLVEVTYPNDTGAGKKIHLKAYSLNIINNLKEMIKYQPLYNEELKFFLNVFTPDDPAALADFAVSLISADKKELQDVLSTYNLSKRMEKVLILVEKELEMIKVQAQIRQDVEEKMSEHQRKFFLKEQLKVIQNELGIAKDDKTTDVELFKDRIDDLTIPEAAKKKIDSELQKLSVLETGSPEYGVTRNYLDTITNLPWGICSKDKFNLQKAKQVLNKEHESLEDIKERILEFMALGELKQNTSGSIILLVGPPGVGKTSIGRTIATTLGRKFFRISVGGMRDEAEIKGHRKTYVGAMPGKIIQALQATKTANSVIMLDEIDKMSSSYHGDPAAALLEVLDPKQNYAFLDHYLETPFDLSKVLFICTANQLDTIPSPLLDRMEVLRLAGYITDEKMAIGKKHLWPKLLKSANIKKTQLKLDSPALRKIIESYAREAGVRNLEKLLAKIVRKAALKIVQHPHAKIHVTKDNIEDYLGPVVFENEQQFQGIGMVTGLAWTALGGKTLTIEANGIHQQTRAFKLTGQMGDVMKESAEIAYSYIAANLEKYSCNKNYFNDLFIHLHVPEGATSKDGPSAGITMACALLSLAKNKAIKKNIAMTGELTLSGQVLAVGGIREKVIAAKRIKIREIILPEAIRGDYSELPDHIRKGITVHFINHFDDIIDLIF